MFKLTAKAGAIASVVLAAQASPAQAVLGPDAAACRGNGPALLVNVTGLKARTGNIRVNVYGGDANRFLERGQYIRQTTLTGPPSLTTKSNSRSIFSSSSSIAASASVASSGTRISFAR